jgi:hypothetical protein
VRSAALAAVVLALAGAPARAHAAGLRAGVGRADITPPTGYYMGGWANADAIGEGVHTRLYARALVLEQGGRKVALVTEDLAFLSDGMVQEAINRVASRGFDTTNVLVSATHTHSAQAGFMNFTNYNTIFAPRLSPNLVVGGFDPQLYGFMVRRLALAIQRADDDLGPARIGWGHTLLLGVTRNRSLEAHLADFGVDEPRGSGTVMQDPGGYADTIDPNVDVLRVDKRLGKRWAPIGMWSAFANHGTVDKILWRHYDADHFASAERVVEAALRHRGRVPATQDVVNVFADTDEGDMSSGLDRSGPTAADHVGRLEAAAMLTAWKSAGAAMTRSPVIATRWTRVCFCGQTVPGGTVDNQYLIGLAAAAGSEEGAGPATNYTGVDPEGMTLPVSVGPQGDKIPLIPDAGARSDPHAVPVMDVRIGDRLIASIPGEMTAEMGKRVRDAVLAAVGASGITSVVIDGLANEYVSYLTSPQEYERQHYEGGFTIYGRWSANLFLVTHVALARALVSGSAAPGAYPFDPRNGMPLDATPFSEGATAAQAVAQPQDVARFEQASFSWKGGPRGFDRPLDRAFITLRRRSGGRWRTIADDRGLQIVWDVGDDGTYRARWEVQQDAPAGTYEFLVTANRYRLESARFLVRPSRALTASPIASGSRVGVALAYPPTGEVLAIQGNGKTFTWHPPTPSGGSATFCVGGRRVRVAHGHGASFTVRAPARAAVVLPAGGATDRFGNTNAAAVTVRAGRGACR